MITSKKAFEGKNIRDLYNNIANGAYQSGLLEGAKCPQSLSTLIKIMFTVERKSRPDIFHIAGKFIKYAH